MNLLISLSILSLGLSEVACGQPRMKVKASASSYQVGDQVDSSTTVLTRDLEPRSLAQIVEPDSKVVVLIIFGGAALSAPDYHPLRAGLWCPDTFDELPLQRALLRQFKQQPVQFVPIATPPAYSDVYGFVRDIFISRSDDDPEYLSQVRTFIDLTERTRQSDVLPFPEVFYDPKFRLAYDSSRVMGPDYGPIPDWQGKFRWSADARKYTTPTIWILSGDLKVLREPFFGNTYNDDPPQIRYEFRDVKESIESFLNMTSERD